MGNSWVEDKTSGEITDFLEDGTITEDTHDVGECCLFQREVDGRI